MSEIARMTENGVIDVVYSPDDGGWYLHEYDLNKKRDRTSRRVFPTQHAAELRAKSGRLQWDRWRG